MFKFSPSPLESVASPFCKQHQVEVTIKRDDLIHPVISGNKWRKLKYLLADAKQKNCQTLVSMGGNYSNHLHALAYAGYKSGFKTLGLVRAHSEQALTPTLEDCQGWAMDFKFINRLDYAQLRQDTEWASYQSQLDGSYWLGEGGFSELAIEGIGEIGKEVSAQSKQEYDYVFCGAGSGATLIGLAKSFPRSKIIGVAAFKGADYLQQELTQQFPAITNWQLETNYHCGGFAKSNSLLIETVQQLEAGNNFQLDKVYNGKVFLALNDLIEKQIIKRGSKVLVIHTGGLQGIRK